MDEERRAKLELILFGFGSLLLLTLLSFGIYFAFFRSSGSVEENKQQVTEDPQEKPQDLDLENLQWKNLGTVSLPTSSVHGPLNHDATTFSGFSQTPSGAGLAALYIEHATSAEAGPEIYNYAFNTHVTKGSDALREKTDALYKANFQNISEDDAVKKIIAGWTVVEYEPTRAVITVFFQQENFSSSEIQLEWVDQTWKMATDSDSNTVGEPSPSDQYPTIDLFPLNPDNLIQPPTDADFAPAENPYKDQPIDPQIEKTLVSFGSHLMSYDYLLTHKEAMEPLEKVTTPEFYLELLNEVPDNSIIQESQQNKRIRRVKGIQEIERVGENDYSISFFIDDITTARTAEEVEFTIVRVQTKGTEHLISEILID